MRRMYLRACVCVCVCKRQLYDRWCARHGGYKFLYESIHIESHIQSHVLWCAMRSAKLVRSNGQFYASLGRIQSERAICNDSRGLAVVCCCSLGMWFVCRMSRHRQPTFSDIQGFHLCYAACVSGLGFPKLGSGLPRLRRKYAFSLFVRYDIQSGASRIVDDILGAPWTNGIGPSPRVNRMWANKVRKDM